MSETTQSHFLDAMGAVFSGLIQPVQVYIFEQWHQVYRTIYFNVV